MFLRCVRSSSRPIVLSLYTPVSRPSHKLVLRPVRLFSGVKEESISPFDPPPELTKLWTRGLARAFHALNPSMPLPLVAEILNLLRDLPKEKPVKVPEQVERRVLELAGSGGAPPRTTLLWVARRFEHTSVYPRSENRETAETIALLVERLLHISWNHGDTERPEAGALLIRPLPLNGSICSAGSIRASHIEVPLCSQEEAAQIHESLMMAKDEMSLFAALSWTQRLRCLILGQEDTGPPEYLQQLKDDFHRALESLLALNEQLSSEKYNNLAASFLGDLYATGDVLIRDGAKAKEYYERALSFESSAHYATPAYRLGQVYLGRQPRTFGDEPLFEPDVRKGLACFERAKNWYPAAAFELGWRYYRHSQDTSTASLEIHLKAKGVQSDDRRAAENFYLAMTRGHGPARIAYIEMILLGRAQPPVVESTAQTKSELAGVQEPAENELNTTDEESYTVPAIKGNRVQFAARPGDGNLLYAYGLAKDFFLKENNNWSKAVRASSPIRQIFNEEFRVKHDEPETKTEA